MKSASPEAITADALGLSPELYAAAIIYLFDRRVAEKIEDQWYWHLDLEDEGFEATPLEWTKIQTVLFANAESDLRPYSNGQVGLGLNYLMDSGISDAPLAAVHRSVPIEVALRMVQVMPQLWRDCIGPRLVGVRAPIGSAGDPLGYVCYMWFDVWPTFYQVRDSQPWRKAVGNVLGDMLAIPCREVQIAALHGIGHTVRDLGSDFDASGLVALYLERLADSDTELRDYATAAVKGMVL